MIILYYVYTLIDIITFVQLVYKYIIETQHSMCEIVS